MLVLLLIIICCVVFGVWLRLRSGGLSPPKYPGTLPLIGHAHLFIGDTKYFWELEQKIWRFCSENGGATQLLLGPHPIYVISNLENCLAIANAFLDKPYVYKFGKELFNRGLITADPTTWKSHRKLLNPTFNQQILNTYVAEHNNQAKSLVSDLSHEVGKPPFDVQPYLTKNVLQNVYKTTLGIKSQENTIKNYLDATQQLFALYIDRFQRGWLHLQFIYSISSLKKKQDKLMGVIKTITNTVINERKSELQLNKGLDNNNKPTSDKFSPLLDHLFYLNDKQNVLTDEEIKEHLNTIVATASNTTPKALTFTLILIGSHQDVQTKLYEEIKEAIGLDQDRDVDRHDLSKLVFLEAVIKESLRLYPPVPRIGRVCGSTAKLKNYTLPAGSFCILSLFHINRDPMWGAEAEQFRPERWLDPTTLPVVPNAFSSFGLGKRNCIGQQYAIMVMKTFIANILRRYRIKSDVTKLETISDVLLKPIDGHHVSLELRS